MPVETCDLPAAFTIFGSLAWATVAGLFDWLARVSWPLVALIAIWAFRRQIQDIASRVTEFGKDGIRLVPPAEGAQQPDPGLTDPIPEGDDAAPLPLVASLEQQIWHDLRERHLAGEQAVRSLVRALAVTQRNAQFEFAQRVIYGTQLAALSALSDRPLTTNEMRSFYVQHVGHVREAGIAKAIDFETWSKFLFEFELAQQAGALYSITEVGTSFLAFMNQIGVKIGDRRL